MSPPHIPQTDRVVECSDLQLPTTVWVAVYKYTVLHYGLITKPVWAWAWATFLEECRHKVVAEELLLNLFSIGWTLFLMPST